MDTFKFTKSKLLVNCMLKYSIQSQENMAVFEQSSLRDTPQLFS
jgi:hypothetical protein